MCSDTKKYSRNCIVGRKILRVSEFFEMLPGHGFHNILGTNYCSMHLVITSRCSQGLPIHSMIACTWMANLVLLLLDCYALDHCGSRYACHEKIYVS